MGVGETCPHSGDEGGANQGFGKVAGCPNWMLMGLRSR